ncbi:hypothetical protein PUMCH_003484 [Australozyma saopauloensis]|uniref:Uncharacterized protein n=1 Tax=Australozyma saopauloensis TaxID=291208 RepID=A0AAX4HCY5_9ASCO|nr:hypothetical protein PUMCH_003484 [[Candida] saopauloensis]
MKLKTIPLQIFLLFLPAMAFNEMGSYKNPNPRPYDNCDAKDLIQLSSCCNDLLSNLDDCKANDLACECCALQNMDRLCYNLCPGNPSANFLSVLLDDCAPLNDVNACNIPFKKVDGERQQNYRQRTGDSAPLQPPSANFVSILSKAKPPQDERQEQPVKPKPKLRLIKSNMTLEQLSSGARRRWEDLAEKVVFTLRFVCFLLLFVL